MGLVRQFGPLALHLQYGWVTAGRINAEIGPLPLHRRQDHREQRQHRPCRCAAVTQEKRTFVWEPFSGTAGPVERHLSRQWRQADLPG